MRRRTMFVVLSAALLLASGCARPQPPAPVRVAPTPQKRVRSFDATALADALRSAGLDVAAPEPTSTFVFDPASKPVALGIGDRAVLVDTFATSAEASKVASEIHEDGFGGPFGGNVFAEVEWRDPPHFFRRDRLIVTYFQSGFPAPTPADSRILRGLEAAMATQFAGYR